MSWLDTLQAQSWYSDVANEFATLAPDVPAQVWQGELLAEDSSLNPAQQDYLNSGHWGLFQEDQAFPTRVGLPAATQQQLQDPTYNSYVAALAMENAIKSSGATTVQAQIEALEKAGWPGTVSAGETASRLADVQQVIAAGGGNPASATTSTGGPWWDPFNGPLNPFGNAHPNVQKAVNGSDIAQAISGGVTSLEQNLLVGGIIIAGITGGFLLLGNSMGIKPPSAVPVPV